MEKITLQYPVTVGQFEYTELEMRRSKVKDRLAVSNMKNASDEDKEIRLFANLCEVTPEVITELDEADYGKLQKTYLSFFASEEKSDEKS